MLTRHTPAGRPGRSSSRGARAEWREFSIPGIYSTVRNCLIFITPYPLTLSSYRMVVSDYLNYHWRSLWLDHGACLCPLSGDARRRAPPPPGRGPPRPLVVRQRHARLASSCAVFVCRNRSACSVFSRVTASCTRRCISESLSSLRVSFALLRLNVVVDPFARGTLR